MTVIRINTWGGKVLAVTGKMEICLNLFKKRDVWGRGRVMNENEITTIFHWKWGYKLIIVTQWKGYPRNILGLAYHSFIHKDDVGVRLL